MFEFKASYRLPFKSLFKGQGGRREIPSPPRLFFSCSSPILFLPFALRPRPRSCLKRRLLNIFSQKVITVAAPIKGHNLDQKKCQLKRGVRLWEVKNIVFVFGWDHDSVSANGRCPPTGGVR